MRVSKEKASENRDALLIAAGRLFRERGIDGVGVADISREAGLTHGALYAHFDSKEALAAVAFTQSFDESFAAMQAATDVRHPTLGGYLDFLLSTQMRDAIASGCPMTASASEVGRHETVSSSFADGFGRMTAAVEATLDGTLSELERRKRALAIVAAEIGAIAVARAVMKANEGLSEEVLGAVREALEEMGSA